MYINVLVYLILNCCIFRQNSGAQKKGVTSHPAGLGEHDDIDCVAVAK